MKVFLTNEMGHITLDLRLSCDDSEDIITSYEGSV